MNRINDMKSEERGPLLILKGISKAFPGVKALDQVDLDLYPGEVHIIAGENGAGKSTLSKCILGVYQPEEGSMIYQGRPAVFKSPREALASGITAVYQELTLIPYLNAAQNIFFNREPRIKGTCIVDHRKMQSDCRELLKDLQCSNMDTSKPVKNLGVADRQMIEIARAISCHPKVIIFDEPTAALTSKETSALFDNIKKLKSQGTGIIYISHRLEEFPIIGDRITVLRDGKKIRTISHSDVPQEELIHYMVGRSPKQVYKRTSVSAGKTLLDIHNLSDREGKVKGCSLEVKSGEITGLAGLVGSGRTELARLIFGIEKPSGGDVIVGGKKLTGRSPKTMARAGIGLIPEDRKQSGLAVKAPIAWNLVAASLYKYFPRLYLSEKKNRLIAGKYIKMLNIRTSDENKTTGELSGGNQQKVVLAKWLASDADILIFDEPTRGIDIGARIEIYQLMDQLAGEGKAILMISSDLQEIISMSDRLYIMSEGRITGELEKKDFNMETIGSMMLKNDMDQKGRTSV